VADDDLPWLFLRVILIVEDASERVVENGARLIDTDTVLPQVRGGLFPAPFKAKAHQDP
jgi:hypothetical protein